MTARPIGSVLVVVTRQIGDVLLTTPLIREARRLWPHARIDVLGFEGTLGMLRGNPDVNELIAMPARAGVGGTLQWARRLWKHYDLALVAEVSDRAHVIGAIAARVRSGILPRDSGSNWWKRSLLRHAVAAGGDRGEVHVVSEKLALLEPWRGEDVGPSRVVATRGESLPAALSAQLRQRYLVVHSPSMWPYKQWPLASFAEVLGQLVARGEQVVLTGGPGEMDRQCVAKLRDGVPQALDAGVLTFNQLATLIAGASLYIGPDTSVSHLAAATGTPVIAVFGPTNPMRWAPWPVGAPSSQPFAKVIPVQHAGNVTLLQSSLPCVPCGRAGCEDHRQSRSECLNDIGADRVVAQALRILSRPA